MGVVVWPMIELEADDALASAARSATSDERVQKVCIWTPDKDLAQCVDGDRVVQVDRKTKTIRDAAGVREKFGVEPALIPDFLALVGDTADGYPELVGIGRVSAARLLNRFGLIESFPREVLGERHKLALLFKPSRPSEPTSGCSQMSMSCAGADRLKPSRDASTGSEINGCSNDPSRLLRADLQIRSPASAGAPGACFMVCFFSNGKDSQ